MLVLLKNKEYIEVILLFLKKNRNLLHKMVTGHDSM